MTVASIPTIAVFPEEKLTLDQKIEKWVWYYCRSLEKNYQSKYPNSSSDNRSASRIITSAARTVL